MYGAQVSPQAQAHGGDRSEAVLRTRRHAGLPVPGAVRAERLGQLHLRGGRQVGLPPQVHP